MPRKTTVRSLLLASSLASALLVLAACGSPAATPAAAPANASETGGEARASSAHAGRPPFWRAFHENCETSCTKEAVDLATCAKFCDCTANRLGEQTIHGDETARLIQGASKEDPATMKKMDEASGQCLRDVKRAG